MKNLKHLGKTLNRKEQKAINGGAGWRPCGEGFCCRTTNTGEQLREPCQCWKILGIVSFCILL